MAITKIHPIKSTLNLAIKYITNENKTDEKILVSTFNCHEDTAYIQFQNTRNFHETKGTVLARHLIQSFLPDELTPELAHEIGKELCNKLLKDNYEYILTTHIDRGHIHNHIIFNNVSFKTGKCYQSNKRTYHTIRAINDELCKENNLIVIDEFYEKYKKLRAKGQSYKQYLENKKGTSWKSKLQFDIDNSIIKSSTWNNFLELMKEKGYEIKYGKHIAFKYKDKERYTRSKTIGEDYTEEKIKERILNTDKTKIKKQIKATKKSIGKIIDIKNNSKIKNSKGYEIWVTKHNLSTMADSIISLRKLGINSKKELDEYIKNNFEKRQNLLDEMKIIDKELTQLDKIVEASHKVYQYKKIYDAYKKDMRNPIFKNDYSNEIKEYKNALKLLKNNYDKMPNTETLCKELEALQEKKNTLYAEYSSINDLNYKLQLLKNNYDKYMNKNLEL
ncbi:relaxase/mobilization nuclease domain-containing protein [Carnobacteriaceae bacterium zg-ZUI78]|nr:relaxase/mobilization nuclease domain-containing protein [Carnobacteriaceae bacterium zg-ZUI78]